MAICGEVLAQPRTFAPYLQEKTFPDRTLEKPNKYLIYLQVKNHRLKSWSFRLNIVLPLKKGLNYCFQKNGAEDSVNNI